MVIIGKTTSTYIHILVYKGVARLQFKKRQSGEFKRRRRVRRGAQGAKRDGVQGGGVPLPGRGVPSPAGWA